MPDFVLYLKASGSAAIVSTLFVLAITGMGRPASTTRLNLASVLGTGLALVIGYDLLSLKLTWPPANGLDRLLLIIVPATLVIELIAGFPCVPRLVAWLMRICLAAAIPRILLHGSVYMIGMGSDQDLCQSPAELIAYSALLAGMWGLLCWLSERSFGTSIPLALSLTTVCSGLMIMMAGYIKGGAATFPLAATLAGTTLGARLMMKRTSLSPMIGIGVVSLFGVLFIGRFFGRLSTGCMLTMLLASLLCWVSETPFLRHRKPWLVESLCLMLVTIPLVTALALAKLDLDREMAPLLGNLLSETCVVKFDPLGHEMTEVLFAEN